MLIVVVGGGKKPAFNKFKATQLKFPISRTSKAPGHLGIRFSKVHNRRQLSCSISAASHFQYEDLTWYAPLSPVRRRPLCICQHNLQNTHPSILGLPLTQLKENACLPYQACLKICSHQSFTCILRECCSGLAHFPKYPEARQFPLPTGICLLINGFSTYIRGSASPQELQHPCEWPLFRRVSACRSSSVQLHTDLSSWRLCFSASGSQVGPHLRPECVCFVS